MRTFIDSEGIEHTVIGYVNHGTRKNFMITMNKFTSDDPDFYLDGLFFPQIWMSTHGDGEVPVWSQRPENRNFTLEDILSHVMLGPVGDLDEYDFFEGNFK